MESVLIAVETSDLVRALRTSTIVYPLLSALHILGIALLVGAILALDARIAGLWRPAAWRIAVDDLAPVAGLGLAATLITGALLFATRPFYYLADPAMLVKLALIAVALVNLALFHRLLRRTAPSLPRAPGRLRALAVSSASLWVGTLMAGRWIAFTT